MPAEVFEGIRETGEEFGEAWNQTGDAPWHLKPWEVIEGGGEITYQAGEGIGQTIDQALTGGELTEGAGEINDEFHEAKREYREARYYRKPDQAIEGGAEVLYETAETGAEFVYQASPLGWFS